MKAFWTIVRRDLTGYFLSPVFYALGTVFLLLTGLLFFSNLLVYTEISFSIMQNPYFSQMLNLSADFIRPLAAQFAVIFLFIIPALTMRSFAEERRSGTLELMLTYPVSDTQVILAKFCSSFLTMCLILTMTLVYPVLLFTWGTPEIAPIASAYVGLMCMAAQFIAIGIFASSVTDNQIVSALVAFGLNLVFWMIGWASPSSHGTIHDLMRFLSIIEHYEPMIKGILKITDLLYFLSVSCFFLFLTGQVLESKKWRG
ncbi:ABC transporter permease subunit [bacterium]|nr:ABC transporter permease subunit [candidate division CSSED10-310 bacterium]